MQGTVLSGEERCPARVSRGSGDDPDVLRLRAFLTLRDLELDTLSVFQRLVAVHLDRREVDEDVLPPVDRDEAVALLAVEPLDGALCHGALPHFDGAVLLTPGAAVAASGPSGVPGIAGGHRRRTTTEQARYTRCANPARPQIGHCCHGPDSRSLRLIVSSRPAWRRSSIDRRGSVSPATESVDQLC